MDTSNLFLGNTQGSGNVQLATPQNSSPDPVKDFSAYSQNVVQNAGQDQQYTSPSETNNPAFDIPVVGGIIRGVTQGLPDLAAEIGTIGGAALSGQDLEQSQNEAIQAQGQLVALAHAATNRGDRAGAQRYLQLANQVQTNPYQEPGMALPTQEQVVRSAVGSVGQVLPFGFGGLYGAQAAARTLPEFLEASARVAPVNFASGALMNNQNPLEGGLQGAALGTAIPGAVRLGEEGLMRALPNEPAYAMSGKPLPEAPNETPEAAFEKEIKAPIIGRPEPFTLERQYLEDYQSRRPVSAEVPPGAVERGDVMANLADVEKPGNAFNLIRGTPEDFKENFVKSINDERAAYWVGQQAKQDFTSLDSLGVRAMTDFQAGVKNSLFDRASALFDELYQKEKAAGIDYGRKSNYLPQMWANPAAQVDQIFTKRLSQKPGFGLEQVIQNYETGIKMGLTPRFNTFSDLVAARVQMSERAVAQKNLFTFLVKNGYVTGRSGEGRVPLQNLPSTFTSFVNKAGERETYVGLYHAQPAIAAVLNNHFGNFSGPLASVARLASGTKGLTMSSGVPFTAISPHGINEWGRNILFSRNPLMGALRGTYWMANPRAAESFVRSNLPLAEEFTRNGGRMGGEQFSLENASKAAEGNLLQQVGQKLSSAQKGAFTDPLFKKFVPGIQLNLYREYKNALTSGFLLRAGIPEEQAGKIAAEQVNNAFGNMNLEALGRSKQLQQLLEATFFAPKWAESHIRIGAGTVRGILAPTDPRFMAYRTFATNLAAAFIGANVINHALSGKFLWENPSGHQFDIDTGTKDAQGRNRFFSPFGTGVDIARLPFEVALSLTQGNPGQAFQIVRSRLSTLASPALSLISNTDYFGNPLVGKDSKGNPIPPAQALANVAGTVARSAGPSYLGTAVGAFGEAKNRPSLEQAAVGGLALPVKYLKETPEQTKQFFAADDRAKASLGTDKYDLAAYQLAQQPATDLNTRLQKDVILATNDRVYQALAQRQLDAAGGDKNKVDPLYTDPRAKTYLAYQVLLNSAPGSKEEKQYFKEHAQDIQGFEKTRGQFFTNNPIPADKQKEYSVPRGPEATAYVQEQMNAKNWKDPQVAQYLSDHNNYTNYLRSLRGLDPLDQYGNLPGSASGTKSGRSQLFAGYTGPRAGQHFVPGKGYVQNYQSPYPLGYSQINSLGSRMAGMNFAVTPPQIKQSQTQQMQGLELRNLASTGNPAIPIVRDFYSGLAGLRSGGAAGAGAAPGIHAGQAAGAISANLRGGSSKPYRASNQSFRASGINIRKFGYRQAPRYSGPKLHT